MEKTPVSGTLRLVITTAFGVLLLLLLFLAIPDVDLGSTLERVRPEVVLAALAFYCGSYACRSLRFRMLIHSQTPPIMDLTAVVASHNLLNMLLPARTGELSYVYLTSRRYGISLSEGAATLLLARLFDVLCIATLFITALIAYEDAGQHQDLLFAALTLLSASLASIFLLVPLSRLMMSATNLAVKSLGLKQRTIGKQALEKGRALIGHAESIRRSRTLPLVFLVTLMQWLMTFATCYTLLIATGVDFSFMRSVLGATGLSVALILPINTFGNAGTFEAGWTFGFVLAGLDRSTALSTAIVAHIFILGFAVLLGGLGYLYLKRVPGNQKDGA